MKKIVPDPPEDLSRRFKLPPGTALSTAIAEGLIPIEEVLSNACHFLLYAYNDTFEAYDGTTDRTLQQPLVSSMRNLEVALGQLDALVAALRQTHPDRPYPLI